MVLALKNKSAQCSFSAMFFEKDKSNKLFIANIEARKAYYFVVGNRSKPNFRSISQSFIQSSFDPYIALFRTYLGLPPYCHQPKKPSLRLDWLLPQSA